MIHYVCIRNEQVWSGLVRLAAKEKRTPAQQGEYMIQCGLLEAATGDTGKGILDSPALSAAVMSADAVTSMRIDKPQGPWSLHSPRCMKTLHGLAHYVNDNVAAGTMRVAPSQVAEDTGVSAHWITQAFSILGIRKTHPRIAGEQMWMYDFSTWAHTEDVGLLVSGFSCNSFCTKELEEVAE